MMQLMEHDRFVLAMVNRKFQVSGHTHPESSFTSQAGGSGGAAVEFKTRKRVGGVHG